METNEKIAELLAWTGKSQAYLAEELGVTRGSITAYLNGRVAVSVDVAYKIAEALHVTPWTVLNKEPLLATPMDMSKDEAKLLTSLRGLNLKQLEVILQTISLFEKQNKDT